MNGSCRSDTWKPTVAAPGDDNGRWNPAESARFWRVNAPKATVGRASPYPTSTPSGVTDRAGGSENPPAGMILARVRTKLSSFSNSTGGSPRSTETSSFFPLGALNRSDANLTLSNGRSLGSTRLKS